MHALIQLFTSAAVIAVAVAGLATIFGVASVRGKMLGFAAIAIGIALAVPMVVAMVESGVRAVVSQVGTVGLEVPSGTAILVVVGHVALAAFLVRRRLARGERVRRGADLERMRTRERPRIAPRPEGPDE